MPAHLLNPDGPDRDQDLRLFLRTLSDRFLGTIEDDEPFDCLSCRRTASTVRQHPLVTPEWIINILFPHCAEVSCVREIVNMAQIEAHKRMRNLLLPFAPDGAPEPTFKLSRHVCGDSRATKKCARCKMTSYCGHHCHKKRLETPQSRVHSSCQNGWTV